MNKKRKREEQSLTPSFITPTKIQRKKISLIETKANKSEENKRRNILSINSPTIEKLEPKIKNNQIKAISTKPNAIALNTIDQLHKQASNKFKDLKKNKNIDYTIILNEVIKIYDLDEIINEYFLTILNDYYISNKENIDNDKTGESNEISELFFKYIFTIGFDKRQLMYTKFDYFQKEELFTEDDRKFFYKEPLDLVFKNFIIELLKISLTIKNDSTKKEPTEYLKDLEALYSRYQFPNSSLKIPIKYGNEELMYMDFIIKFQTAFCTSNEGFYERRFFDYKITTKFLALNFFEDYFSLETYDILSLQYIIFCINTFFLYYDVKKPIIEIIESQINHAFLECSRFLYQDFKEKKAYLKKISAYIKNDVDLDNINEEYLEKNLLIINYNNKEIKINGNNCFFLGNRTRLWKYCNIFRFLQMKFIYIFTKYIIFYPFYISYFFIYFFNWISSITTLKSFLKIFYS